MLYNKYDQFFNKYYYILHFKSVKYLDHLRNNRVSLCSSLVVPLAKAAKEYCHTLEWHGLASVKMTGIAIP